MAGGHCTFNPEPLADFVDVFVIGDGEEVVSEITEVVREWKAGGRTPGSRRSSPCSASTPRSRPFSRPPRTKNLHQTKRFVAGPRRAARCWRSNA